MFIIKCSSSNVSIAVPKKLMLALNLMSMLENRHRLHDFVILREQLCLSANVTACMLRALSSCLVLIFAPQNTEGISRN